MPVTKRTRYEVLKRDNFTCRYCRSTEQPLKVDHVTPVALGGGDDPSNLVAACQDCNAGKASTSPSEATVADVKATDFKWADAMRRASELRQAELAPENEYLDAFEKTWQACGAWGCAADPDSVRRLFHAGLPIEAMTDAARIAGTQRGVRDRFAYFMGTAWKMLTALQETAKQLLEADEVSE